MATKICMCCGQPFQPRPQVPNQAYCSSKACQRERRQLWLRDKVQNDPLYRENLRDAQQTWRTKNPGYWRKYRDTNSEYAEKNRSQQRSKKTNIRKSKPAKIDASSRRNVLPDGIYHLKLVKVSGIAKIDEWIVKISPVCDSCPCKTDVCKDRS